MFLKIGNLKIKLLQKSLNLKFLVIQYKILLLMKIQIISNNKILIIIKEVNLILDKKMIHEYHNEQ